MISGRDYLETASRYERAVCAGEIEACRWVKLACVRNVRDRERAGTPAFPYSVDSVRASAICRAIELMPHIKGDQAKQVKGHDGTWRWQTIELQPWQVWILTTVFGWVRLSDGRRRFRTVLILVPRKNGKSLISAGVALYMLAADGEAGAECYSAATSRDQAKIPFGLAHEIVKRSPQLREHFGIEVYARALMIESTASKFEPLSADAHNLDGLNVHIAVVDELHAHQTRRVWDVLETATSARLQPMIWAISTAGTDTGGICYEQLQYLQQILQGTVQDETYFGVNYSIDEGDDWREEAIWRKANPNFGVSIQADDLARKAHKAEHSPAGINTFLTKHLNVWVQGETPGIPMEAWHACTDSALTLEGVLSYPCWLGIDLAEVRDIAAVVALFRLSRRRYAAIGRFYLPQETIDRSPIAQYSGWARSGYLIATEGAATDYTRIEEDIATWCEQLNVQRVCFDRALAAQMGQRLQARLGRKPEVITVNQTVEVFNPAMQVLEAALVEHRFAHTGDPVFAWAASNVVVVRNHKGEVFPRKAGGKDSQHKIDPISALLTAMSQAMLVPDDEVKAQSRGRAKLWTPSGWREAVPL